MRTRLPAPALAIPGLAVLLFAAAVVLYLAHRPAYLAILNALHLQPYPRPFLDTRFVTAQVECWQRAIDVYARNPCDPLGRTQDYSPLWLRLGFLGRSDRWTPWLGLATDLVFLGSLFMIPWRRQGAVVAVLAVVSWTTAFGLERGNTDLLILAGAVAVAHLRLRSGAARGVGYALVLGMGLLKFYPLTLLALAVRERAVPRAIIGALCGAVLLAFVAMFHGELARIGANMATGYFGDKFGVRTLPVGLVTFGRALCQAHGLAPGPMTVAVATVAVLAALAAACLSGGVSVARDMARHRLLDRVAPLSRSLLLVSAVLSVGCFFGHQNIAYRGVMLLPAMPALLELARVGLAFRAAGPLVVLVLWGPALAGNPVVWLAVQLGWWWIVAVLGAVIAAEGHAHYAGGAWPWTLPRAVALGVPQRAGSRGKAPARGSSVMPQACSARRPGLRRYP